MTHAEWLVSEDVAAMLAHLEEAAGALDFPFPSDRKLRLFACACCRALWPLLADDRSRRAVEVAERYADGEATEAERSAALHDRSGRVDGPDDPWLCCADTALYAARYVGYDTPIISLGLQASLLRCVAGDPFAPVVPLESLRRVGWLFDPTVLALAGACYRERGGKCRRCKGSGNRTRSLRPRGGPQIGPRRQDVASPPEKIVTDCHGTGAAGSGRLDPQRLLILRDSLIDAGCDSASLLEHLASPGPHVRGCWCVDLILGKS